MLKVGSTVKVKKNYALVDTNSESNKKLIGKKGIVLAVSDKLALVRFKQNWNGFLHRGDSDMVYANQSLCWFIEVDSLKQLNRPVVDISLYMS